MPAQISHAGTAEGGEGMGRARQGRAREILGEEKIKYYARGHGRNDNRMPCTHACMYVRTGQDRTGEERTEQLEIAYIEKNYIDRSSRNAEYSSGRCVLKCSAIYGYIHIQEYIL